MTIAAMTARKCFSFLSLENAACALPTIVLPILLKLAPGVIEIGRHRCPTTGADTALVTTTRFRLLPPPLDFTVPAIPFQLRPPLALPCLVTLALCLTRSLLQPLHQLSMRLFLLDDPLFCSHHGGLLAAHQLPFAREALPAEQAIPPARLPRHPGCKGHADGRKRTADLARRMSSDDFGQHGTIGTRNDALLERKPLFDCSARRASSIRLNTRVFLRVGSTRVGWTERTSVP